MKPMSSLVRPLGLGFLLVSSVGLVACGDDDTEATTTTTTAAVSTTTTEAGPPELQSEPVDLDLPRSVTYANLEFTVQAVTVSNATPGTYLDDEPEAGDSTYAYVDTTVTAELDDPGDRVDVEILSLELADGSTIDAEGVAFGSGVAIETGVANELSVAFPIEAAEQLDGATLVVTETGRVPARLPLDGPVPDDPYPVAIAVSGTGSVAFEGGCQPAAGTFTVTGAEVDLDAGADHKDKALEPNQSKRAKQGERWLRVDVQTVAQHGTCGGTIAGDNAFRLIIDGLPTPPLNQDNELLADGAGTEFVWGWTVPVDATLVLQVGLAGDTTVDVPIQLPADLP